MTKLFISYSRKDIDFARKLHSALKEINVDAWIDWIDIAPVADWWKQIQKGIESADGFLFLLSPDSILSDVCNREIEHATKNGKRLIPLVVRDVDSKDVHPALAMLNWIFFRDQDDFAASLEKLKKGINTDLAWVEYHTRLQIRALEWGSGKNTSRLLRGTDLREAEEKLATSGNKEPQPTDLQRQYTLESRKGASRTRTILLSIGAVVIAALTLLSILALNQSSLARNNASTAVANQAVAQTAQIDAENQRGTAVANEQEAIRQEKISRAGELAAQSIAVRDTNFPLAALLGLESFHIQENFRTKAALLSSFTHSFGLKTFLDGHSTRVKAVMFGGASNTLISAGCKTFDNTSQICSKGEVFVWDLTGEKPVYRSFEGHEGWIFALAYDPETNAILSAGDDERIIVWNEAGKQIGSSLDYHSDSIISLSLDTNKNVLASGDISGHLFVHDMKNGRTVLEYKNEEFTGPIAAVAFGTDGNILAVSLCGNYQDREATKCSMTSVAIFDLSQNKIIGYLDHGHTDLIRSIAFSPDGKFIATGGNDSRIILWDAQTFKPTGKTLTGHLDWIFSLQFTDDTTLASSSADNTIILWDLENAVQTDTFTGHADWVNSLAVHPTKGLLAAASEDGSISLWDVGESSFGTSIPAHQAIVTTIAMSPDRQLMVSGDLDGVLTLWDPKEQKKIEETVAEINETRFAVTSIALSSSGIFATGHLNGILVWDSDSLAIQEVLSTREQSVTTKLSFSSDGQYLASSSSLADNSTTLVVWSMSTFEKLYESSAPDVTSANATFSPVDSDIFAFGNQDNNVVVWQLSTAEMILPPLTGHLDSISSIAFSPDGKTVAAASYQQIILWDVQTGQQIGLPLKSTQLGLGTIESMAFSPDGTLLATNGCGTEEGCTEPQIVLWDIESHQVLGEIQSGKSQLFWIYPTALSFNADGTALISGGCNAWDMTGECSEGHLVFWDVNPQGWFEKTCERAGRNLTSDEWIQYFPGEPYRTTCPQWPLGGQALAVGTLAPTPTLQVSESPKSQPSNVTNALPFISLIFLFLCCFGGLLVFGAGIYLYRKRSRRRQQNN